MNRDEHGLSGGETCVSEPRLDVRVFIVHSRHVVHLAYYANTPIHCNTVSQCVSQCVCFSVCVSVCVFQCVYRSLVPRTQLARRHCMSIRVDGKTDDVVRVAEVKGLCVCRGIEDDPEGSGIVDHLHERS